MVRARDVVPAVMLAVLTAYPVVAQDTSAFPYGVAGQGKRCYFGECEDSAPPQAAAPAEPRENPPPTATPAPQKSARQQRDRRPKETGTSEAALARPTPAPSPTPSYQRTTNFANELTDFGVPPQKSLQTQLGSLTPMSVPGARVVTTLQLRNALRSGQQFLLVDAWDDTRHETIPGAVHISYAGRPGTFYDAVQKNFFQELRGRTGSNPGYPIVFYCAGPDCWESYNATLRAEAMGFSNVFWYRGGMAAWRESTTRLGLR
jgi:PQQ-dependent catabolism-associated CXXCW motif protein